MGPAGPVGPVSPVGPVGPAGPVSPAGPAGPMGPAGPAVRWVLFYRLVLPDRAHPAGPCGPAVSDDVGFKLGVVLIAVAVERAAGRARHVGPAARRNVELIPWRTGGRQFGHRLTSDIPRAHEPCPAVVLVITDGHDGREDTRRSLGVLLASVLRCPGLPLPCPDRWPSPRLLRPQLTSAPIAKRTPTARQKIV